MREKTLRNITVICSIVGLIMLFLISKNLELELKPTNIGDITIDDLEKVVKICGTVTDKFVSKNKHIFLRIRDDTGDIKVVIFKNDAENLKRFKIDVYNLGNGDEICVHGLVKEYEKEIEIVCNWIEI